MQRYRFRLYVAGDGDLARRAILNLTSACEALLYDRYEIEVIDILEQRGVARQRRIVATPLMIKWDPEPEVRIVGDLADRDSFALALGLSTANLPTHNQDEA